MPTLCLQELCIIQARKTVKTVAYKPGESGNPAGRPPGTTDLPKEYEGMTHKQIFRRIAIHKAIPLILKHIEKKDSLEAANIALQYGFGKPIQQQVNVNLNMNYSSWTDAEVEEFSETGQMPMLQGDQEDNKPAKDTKQSLNGKSKEVKE